MTTTTKNAKTTTHRRANRGNMAVSFDPRQQQPLAGDGLNDTMARMNTTISTNGVSISQTRGLTVDGVRLSEAAVSRQDIEFDDDGHLGSGASSVVRRASDKRDRRVKYAVKIFKILDEGRRSQLMKELRVLFDLDCQSLVQFHGAYKEGERVGVVLEYMDRGSLENVVDAHRRRVTRTRANDDDETGDGGSGAGLPEKIAAAVFFQIIWGLAYLHYEKRLHRDVKPANVLVNSRGEVKLSDFGIARELSSDEDGNEDIATSTVVGTFRFMSPERLHGSRYSFASDLWSVGVMLVDAIRGKALFSAGASPISIVQQLKDRGDGLARHALAGTHASEALVTFASECLKQDPFLRPQCDQLLTSPWLDDPSHFDGLEPSLEAAVHVLAPWLADLARADTSARAGEPAREPTRRQRAQTPAARYDPDAHASPLTHKSSLSSSSYSTAPDHLLETMRSSVGDCDDVGLDDDDDLHDDDLHSDFGGSRTISDSY